MILPPPAAPFPFDLILILIFLKPSPKSVAKASSFSMLLEIQKYHSLVMGISLPKVLILCKKFRGQQYYNSSKTLSRDLYFV